MLLKIKNLISLQNIARPILIQSRCYPGTTPGMKHDLYNHIKWVRPAYIPSHDPLKSGDLEKLPLPDDKTMLHKHENAKALELANELVKKKFSLELNSRKAAVRIVVHQMMDRVRRYDMDNRSMEAKLAFMTAKIRTQQEAYESNIRNKKLKQKLVELIAKRKKYLKQLRKADYKCFEYILERLNIRYIPQPESVHQIERKAAMKSLTFHYCKQIRLARMEEYKKVLESQQLTFLEDKIRNLELIRQEQKECKVPITITQEQIDAVKKQYAELKKQRAEEAEIRKKNEVRDDYEIKLI